MTGTAFSAGQLAELQTMMTPSMAVALPKVAAKFPDPKAVLRALKDKGEILAGRLEGALEAAIRGMMILIARDQVSITLDDRRDPGAYFQTRSGLYVYGDFRSGVVSKAGPVAIGTSYKLDAADLGQDASDEAIESALSKDHIFAESPVCAIIAQLIAKQANGEEGTLLNNGYANLFYTSSFVVDVYWDSGRGEWRVDTWGRGDRGWGAGHRVFSPGN
jgi:hypothetical protein